MERHGYRKVRDQLSREIRHGRITQNESRILENHFANRTLNIDEFFNWLGITQSGKLWFIDHKLKRTNHLINRLEEHFNAVKLPMAMSEIIVSGNEPKKRFIAFGKEVFI